MTKEVRWFVIDTIISIGGGIGFAIVTRLAWIALLATNGYAERAYFAWSGAGTWPTILAIVSFVIGHTALWWYCYTERLEGIRAQK